VAGALKSGIIDTLAGREPATAAEVAAAAGADPRATEIVIEALVAEKLVDRDGDRSPIRPSAEAPPTSRRAPITGP